jgi:hypothetical protein
VAVAAIAFYRASIVTRAIVTRAIVTRAIHPPAVGQSVVQAGIAVATGVSCAAITGGACAIRHLDICARFRCTTATHRKSQSQQKKEHQGSVQCIHARESIKKSAQNF